MTWWTGISLGASALGSIVGGVMVDRGVAWDQRAVTQARPECIENEQPAARGEVPRRL